MFREAEIYRSIHSVETGYPLHNSLADAGPSLIDLWELQQPDGKQDIEGWRAPFDGRVADEPRGQTRPAHPGRDQAAGRKRHHDRQPGKRRPLRYGDMLVLVRRRGNAFDAVIQALKHADIPVAGADRLKLTEHIAIIDLMNLADALLLPQDDLALAVALKSPLFGLSDDDLFTLAWQRKGSLRDALERITPPQTANSAGALDRLQQCERRFDTETPFAFYAWLLGGDGGRARILRRLGHEANDALDEFLELALGYERKAPASLQGFMAWLRAADIEVKRDMEISRDEVRVMTVHGAKGLEASVVFLVDTTSSPSDTQRLQLIHLPRDGGEVVVWAGRKADDPAARRGRAHGDAGRDRGRISPPALCGDDARGRPADRRRLHAGQHEQRAQALLVRPDRQGARQFRIAAKRPSRRADGPVKRYARSEDVTLATGAAAAAAASTRRSSCRHGCTSRRRRRLAADGLLRPSDPAEDEDHRVRTGESVALRARALQRGTLVHRLLQSLPDLAAERRRDAALKYLARNAGRLDRGEREALAQSVLALIGDAPLRAGVRRRQPRRGLDRRAGWSGRDGRRRWFPGRSTGWW